MQTNVHIDTKNLRSPEHRIKGGGQGRTYEELVVTSPNERNWRGIFIALLVIVAVLGLILFSIVLVSPPEEGPRNIGIKPSLEDIILKLPDPAKFNGTWISDSEFIFTDSQGGVSLYNAENLTTKVIMTNSTFRQYDAVDYKISSTLKHVLLICDVKKLYKYTTLAKYYIYEIHTRIIKPLSHKELDLNAPYLQYATWSPDGTGVAFVHDNDVYYKPKIDKNLVCRITMSGVLNEMYNGVPDWLYENEILRTSHTLWFSPDGVYLLYLSFNDTNVGEYKYTWYDSGNPGGIYPEIRSFRFPKPDTPNPEVKAWIVNLTTPKYLFPVELKPTASVDLGSYITHASFYAENGVNLVWLNRNQNVSVMVSCDAQNSYNCTDFHVEKEHIGWTEPIFHPVYSYNGTQALVRLPVKDGANGHYMHACQVFNSNVVPLTHGAFEITKILGWDEEKHILYAIATNENQPGVRHLFKLGDMNSSQSWTCLTCQPKIDPNVTNAYFAEYINETMLNNSLLSDYKCDYNNVIFSKSFKYYIQECLGPDIPVVFLVETAQNVRMAVLDTGSRLRKNVNKFAQPQIKKIQVEIEFGYKAQVKMYLPPVLREYEDVAFPMVLLVDAAPFSQTVSSKWDIDWAWYLASTRSYVVAQIDARGSGYQGIKMRSEIQRRLGTIEIQDQLNVLTYLRDTFKFIDRGKICTIGKGYGGYASAMMMIQDFHQVINCSVSLSPITNWMNYNSYYTEKYLGFPSKFPQAYENADLLSKAGSLLDRRFLLIHGTSDSTVTPQHSFMFAKALVQRDVLFQHLAYPDETHEFTKLTTIHMYKEIDQFLNDSFGPVLDEWSDTETSFFIQ
ncbi:inactive dipeptidyl peptidase 10 isoform X3 [Coccinella septempunctata]|uniref:inactive dipeptidyl peptidase 10 isoform X3 n=1 Tax=Coccinella septempunctata TaxID=41139 RepID=UPI001D091F04|nr:inactive dipeptidyl peptidase 10 isoform X3 [Coccinella septempunctata]